MEGAMSNLLTDRYRNKLAGILSCFDRILITGTLPTACFAQGMTNFLNARGIRIFDYPRFAEPLRNRIRANAHTLAEESGLQIQHIAKAHIRKEDVVAKVLAERGEHPGLVHILSAMEACPTYEPWHDKKSHQTFLRADTAKCLHYYFYFIDEVLGLIHLRVPTWCPFRLQFYCNGHSWLARSLATAQIDFAMADNAFVRIANWEAAQKLADQQSPDILHPILDRYAKQCCPVLDVFEQSYHWSLMQIEYSTDFVFRSKEFLKPLFEELSRQAIFSVKADQVASFLGKKITPQLAQEIGSRFTVRIEGTCLKHRYGSASVKMYDKFGQVLRLETTTNDVSFFKHYRKVEHRDGSCTRQLANLKKSIYSLQDLRGILRSCNRRYHEFLSALEDHSTGNRNLSQLTTPQKIKGHTLKGFNFFDPAQQALLRSLQRPEFNINGFRRANLLPYSSQMSASSLSRRLWQLRHLGIIKKVAHSYRYYLTQIGRGAIAAACRIATEIIPKALEGLHL